VLVELVSIILHVIAYAKIYLYRRKILNSVGPQTFKDFQETNSWLKIDSQSLIGNGMNFLIFFNFALNTLSASKVTNGKPEDFNKFPYNLFIYYQYLTSPGLFGLLFVISMFNRNKNLRKTICNEIKDFWRK
jgi:hypothetical protein